MPVKNCMSLIFSFQKKKVIVEFRQRQSLRVLNRFLILLGLLLVWRGAIPHNKPSFTDMLI